MESGGDGLGRKGGERESTHRFLNSSKSRDTKFWGNHYEVRHEQFDHIVVDCTKGG